MPNESAVIRAAGGLLWRRSGEVYRLAVVHRVRYDDWSLPKGKLKRGEPWPEAALREVCEETGSRARLLAFAGALAYQTSRGPKVVRFWHMLAEGEMGVPKDPTEIADVAWLTVDEARERLQYEVERALVEAYDGPVGV